MVLTSIAKALCFILSVQSVAAGLFSGLAITTNVQCPSQNGTIYTAGNATSSATFSTSASSSLNSQERTSAATLKLVTPSPMPACPSANGTEYTTPMGDIFIIECHLDREGSDIKMIQVGSLKLSDCIDACSATPDCVDISMSGSACYMKNASVRPITNQAIRGARMVYSANNSTTLPVAGSSSPGSDGFSTLDCPSSNGTSYTAANGATFVIECGLDRAGNDLSMVHVDSGHFSACSACYMKHDIGAHIVQNGASGARLVQTSKSSSTSSSVTEHHKLCINHLERFEYQQSINIDVILIHIHGPQYNSDDSDQLADFYRSNVQYLWLPG
ncbi:hypothetical protein KCU65_g9787, partial [Aureobasidium melanogenum]